MEGDRIKIDVCGYRDGSVVIYPRVIIGETLAKELEVHLGGAAWVDFKPTATYVPVVLNHGVSPDLVREQILGFLTTNWGRWLFPK